MKLGIYGAGGTGKAFFDQVIGHPHRYQEVFFIDDSLSSLHYRGARVLSFRELRHLPTNDIEIIVALGDPRERETVCDAVKRAGYRLGTWIHPGADISPTAVIGEGCYIDRSFIDNNVVIGNDVYVYPSAVIGHDSIIEDHSMVSACAFIGGHSKLGTRSYFGPGASCRDGVSIGSDAIVGVGAAVYKDVSAGDTAIGNPARMVHRSNGAMF